MLTRKAVVGSL